MRLDKFLKVSRIIKRRTVAAQACDSARVALNGKTVKPAHNVNEGDVITLTFGGKTASFKVKYTDEKSAKAAGEPMAEEI